MSHESRYYIIIYTTHARYAHAYALGGDNFSQTHPACLHAGMRWANSTPLHVTAFIQPLSMLTVPCDTPP